jgi:hypothetical protein
MIRKIKVRISKEDIYDVQELIDEIQKNPKSAHALCDLYGEEGFPYDAFVDFDFLSQEAKDRLIVDLATSKSDAGAALSFDQIDMFDPYPQFIEVGN